MKNSLHRLILAAIFSLAAFSAYSQTAAQIIIDGSPAYISPTTKFPIWLTAGQTIAASTNVTSISAIEYNVTTSPAGGNILTLSGVKKITTSTYTVAANQTLKVEGVILNPAVSGSGTQWLIGGNTAPGSPVIGSVDNSPVSIQTGTGTLGVGADAAAKTINVGNSTGATTVNVNTGTGGYNLTTGTGGSATTTLGTGGNAVFGSSTANADKIAIQPQTTSGATNTGTITSADLTGARTYTLPDASGTVAVSATGNIALSATGNVTLTGTIPSTNGGTGVNNAGTITNAGNTTITGGGTLGLGGNTLTVPGTGTAALGTGNTNYNTYWSGTNTLAAEQYTSVTRGGLGADVTASGIGSIPYSSSTTAYTTLADVAAGSYLRSGGVNTAPAWSGITLPNSAATAGEIWYSSGTGTMASLARSATQGTILMNNSAGTPSWTTLAFLPSTSGIIPPANLGTGTPTGTTFLNGTGAWSTPSVTLSGGTTNAVTYWSSSSAIAPATTGTPANGMYWDNTNGRLGIGSASPTSTMYLYQNGSTPVLQLYSNRSTGSTSPLQLMEARILFGGVNNGGWSTPNGAGIDFHTNYPAETSTGRLNLWAYPQDPANPVLTIWNNRVGIGATSPAYKLDVSGDARFTGGTIYNGGTGTYWNGNNSSWNSFYTPYGGIQLGPANGSWAHIYSTNSLNFYFNTAVYVAGLAAMQTNGEIWNYNTHGGGLGLTGDLPGYGAGTYPTLKTPYSNIYFSAGGVYSAYMTSGGSFAVGSSRYRKQNFEGLDRQEILAKINMLEMYKWEYKCESTHAKHIGPIAQDFYAKFHLGECDSMISVLDPAGVALVGIQALSKTVDELKNSDKTVNSEIALLKNRLEALEKENAQLKADAAKRKNDTDNRTNADEIKQMKAQLEALRELMEKNGIRSER